MKNMLKNIYSRLRVLSPFVYYLIQYKRAVKKLSRTESNDQSKKIFEEFIRSCENKSCLQIGVKNNVGKKYGPNWVSVDKFDMRDFIDCHDDIHDLSFEDESFDAVVCISILEHVPHPLKAISEFKRVLKPGGKIWVQLPWLYPYHEVPKDYWRVSPDGLRTWTGGFKEISCGIDLWDKSYLSIST